MSEKWIIPCNLRFFDVEKHFTTSKVVVWKNSFTMKVGDAAYIYLSAPISAIRYRCRVISDTVNDDELQENQYAIQTKESHNYFSKKTKYVIMELEKEYPKDLLTLAELRKRGLGQVQIQARADRKLSAFLNEIDNNQCTESENGGDDDA